MQRMSGLALVVVACTAIGCGFSRELLERIRALRELEQLTSMLRGEIQYAATPLQEAFRELAARSGKKFAAFFAQIAQQMEQRDGRSLAQIFASCAQETLSQSGCSGTDRESLVRLGGRLGYLDREMQLRTLELYLEELAREREAAEEEYRKKARMYQCLGFLGGWFLVLLLL